MPPTDQNNAVILEANPVRRDYLKSIISDWGFKPFIFEKESTCLDNLASLAPDLAIAGSLSFTRMFRFINTLKARNWCLPVLIISEDNRVHDYAYTSGFDDVLVVKSAADASEMKQIIDDIRHNKFGNKKNQNGPLIIGNSAEVRKIKRIISELGPSKEPVLIQGEAGTGKDLLARAIHYASDRKNNPLIKIDTTALPQDLLENRSNRYNLSDISGGNRKKEDVFALADTGTIFLDKIEAMPVSLQAKLIHLFESELDLNFESEGKSSVDVRVIAATHPDIEIHVESGKIRKDLYFRLNVINIGIPPLRYRTEDIPLLAAFFNDKFCGQFGKSHYDLSEETMQILKHYRWPGNVRELKEVIKHAARKSNEKSIVERLLSSDDQNKSVEFIDCCEDIYVLSEISDVKKSLSELKNRSLKDICREFVTRTEKKLMKKALERTNWNRKEAASLLDISYKSLLNKIKAYNLT